MELQNSLATEELFWRNIKDYICLVSHAVNMLDMNSHSGNLAMKVDISKAFDTLNYNFLLNVLKKFGFSNTFCPLLFFLLFLMMFLMVFLIVLGELDKETHCPQFFFYLAEEVLSRGISKLAYDGKLDLMKTSKNIYFSSHVFNLTKLLFYVQESLLTCKSLPSYSLINLLPLVRFLAHLSLLFFRALCLIEY